MPATSTDRSSYIEESDRLPPIVPPATTSFRYYSPNGKDSSQDTRSHNKNSSPTTEKKYISKTMNTNTTLKKHVSGGPVVVNGAPKPSRTVSSESVKRSRKLWWSPQRNYIEIRSENSRFKNIPSKVGSFTNIQYRPGGGQVLIRDEPTQWHASSKVGSLSNANWAPPASRVTVRSEKLNWDVNAKVGSMDNIDHKPLGGNVAIRDEKIDLNHVTPRVDCGFID